MSWKEQIDALHCFPGERRLEWKVTPVSLCNFLKTLEAVLTRCRLSFGEMRKQVCVLFCVLK